MQGFLDQHAGARRVRHDSRRGGGCPGARPRRLLDASARVHAHEGRVPLWQALLVMEVAALLGASFLYLLAARAGRGLVYHHGRYMHLTPERLDRAERWLLRRGSMAIVLGRVTPGLRIATV